MCATFQPGGLNQAVGLGTAGARCGALGFSPVSVLGLPERSATDPVTSSNGNSLSHILKVGSPKSRRGQAGFSLACGWPPPLLCIYVLTPVRWVWGPH